MTPEEQAAEVLGLLDRLEAAEADAAKLREIVAAMTQALARVEVLVRQDADLRAEHESMDDCGCSYKDCYECGMWCRCVHGPYAALRAAIEGKP